MRWWAPRYRKLWIRRNDERGRGQDHLFGGLDPSHRPRVETHSGGSSHCRDVCCDEVTGSLEGEGRRHGQHPDPSVIGDSGARTRLFGYGYVSVPPRHPAGHRPRPDGSAKADGRGSGSAVGPIFPARIPFPVRRLLPVASGSVGYPPGGRGPRPRGGFPARLSRSGVHPVEPHGGRSVREAQRVVGEHGRPRTRRRNASSQSSTKEPVGYRHGKAD